MARRRSRIRRRYGRMRGRIDFARGGVVAAESVSLTKGHVYAMGASSSPDMIQIDYVTDDRIGYHRTYKWDGKVSVIERWIGEDLIAQGERTFKARYGVSAQRWKSMTEAERRAQLKGRI